MTNPLMFGPSLPWDALKTRQTWTCHIASLTNQSNKQTQDGVFSWVLCFWCNNTPGLRVRNRNTTVLQPHRNFNTLANCSVSLISLVTSPSYRHLSLWQLWGLSHILPGLSLNFRSYNCWKVGRNYSVARVIFSSYKFHQLISCLRPYKSFALCSE